MDLTPNFSLPIPNADPGNLVPQLRAEALAIDTGLGLAGIYINVKSPAYGAIGDGTTNDAASISSAISAAVALGGGTVYFPRGNYLINTAITTLNSSSDITFRGNGATISTTLNGNVFNINSVTRFRATGLRFVGNYAGTPNNQHAFNSNPNGTGITIDHCTFETLSAGIFFGDGGSDINIHDNYFLTINAPIQAGTGAIKSRIHITNNTFIGSASIATDDAVAISGANEDVVITGNLFDYKGSVGSSVLHGKPILLESSTSSVACQRALIANNILRNSIGTNALQPNTAGILVTTGGSGIDWSDVTVQGNIIENCYVGIFIEHAASGFTVKGNTIRTLTNDGIKMTVSGDDVLIEGNHIYSAGHEGIEISNPDRPRIINNLIVSAADKGIFIDASAQPIIANNTIRSATSDGIIVSNAVGAIITGNYLKSNGGYGINFSGTVTNPYLVANRFESNTSGATNGYTATATNLRGQDTFASAATKAVTIATEPDANYYVAISSSVNETIWVTTKTTTGFTLNSSNATSTAVVDWILVR